MLDSTTEKVDSTGYAVLRDGIAVQMRPDAGLLMLTDDDRHDFLHRMTTNQINGLQPGQATVTVLTSPTARVLFVFTVLCRPDALILLPAAGRTTSLEQHLRGQIFFMDKVKVANKSGDYTRMRIMGDRADAALTGLGFSTSDFADGTWREYNGILAVKQMVYDVPGIEIAAPQSHSQQIEDQLAAAGAITLSDNTAYTTRRIELGRPSPGYELTDEFNPLEAGLRWACAEDKGCYTGQEIIARQITYDKVTKTLVGLRSAQTLREGAAVEADERNIGTVTSAGYSPALDGFVALAIIKRPYNQPETDVLAGGIPAQVVELPFVGV